MIEKASQIDVMRLLPLTAGLWLGYLLALLLIDHLFYPHPVFPPLYYLVNGFNALAVLGLALWRPVHTWLGRAFLPLEIGLMAVTPVITTNLIGPLPPPGPANGPEATTIRLMPVLLMALILTAWQYRWREVILFSGGIALLGLGLHLLFFRPGEPFFWPPVTVLIIQTISFLVVGYFTSSLIRQLRQQQESLAQANAQLTGYTATLEELTISRERNRLARELHDTLAHTLSALSVQLETARAYWEVDPAVAQQMLDRSLAATRSGLQETRRALKSLRASPLEDLGLALALRQMVTETAARANLQLELAVPDHLPALSPAVEQCLYRVAQEAVANVAHHARACTLTVQLTVNGPIALRVSDDGRGFDPHQEVTAGHFGLSGMRERAQMVGGHLTITGQPGQGATVQLIIEDGRDESNHLR